MHLMVTMAVMVLSKGLSLARVSTGRLRRKPQLSRRRTCGGDVCLVVGDVNGGEVHLQGGGAGGAEAFKAGEEALVVDRQLLLFLELGDHDDHDHDHDEEKSH